MLFLIGCDNWTENPGESAGVIETNNHGTIQKLSYPEKTYKIYFRSDGTILVGSSDGKFFKSSDDGKTWQQTGEINSREAINCFFEYEENSTKKKFIYAGTEDGIYISDDGGQTWKESLGRDENANPTKVYLINLSKNYSNNIDSILAFGSGGKYNLFCSVDNGKSWERLGFQKQYNSRIKTKIEYLLPINGYLSYRRVLYGVYYPLQMQVFRLEYIVNQMTSSFSMSVFPLYGDYEFNSMLFTGTFAIAGSNNGIYKEATNSSLWQFSGLRNYKVNKLIYTGSMLIAATDSGIHYSTDNSVTWRSFNPGWKAGKWKEIYQRDNYFYIINEAGETYKLEISSSADDPVYNPLSVTPADGAGNVKTDVTLSWNDWQINGEYIYALEISTDPLFPEGTTEFHDYIYKPYYECKGLKNKTRYYWRLYKYTLFKKIETVNTYSFVTQ